MPQTIFSWLDYMDFELADSLLHFNDGKMGHASIFSQIRLDVVSILTFNIGRTTPAVYVPALQTPRKSKKKKIRQSKREKRKDQEDNCKMVEGPVYIAGAGFDNF